jgi:hypothetical protein
MSMDDDPGPFKLGQHGGPRKKGERGPNSTLKRGSSSVAYIEARLARDASEGCREAAVLLQGIHDGRVSAYACAIEMNYARRREPTGRVEYPNVTKKNDWAMHKLLNPKKKGPTLASEPEFSNREESPNVSALAKP